MNLCQKLDLDEIDVRIINLLQKNPNLPQSQIAREVQRSQPAVRSRVEKLKEKKLLCEHIGVNILDTNLKLAFVRFSAKVPQQTFASLSSCPNFVQVFKTSGSSNFLAIVGGHSLTHIEELVDRFLRAEDNVTDVDFNFITNSLYSAIFPYDLQAMSTEEKQNGDDQDQDQVASPREIILTH